MKALFFSICLSFFCLTAFSQGFLTVRGAVAGDTKGFNKIYVYGDDIESDSTIIKNGHFEFKIPFKMGMIPVFYSEYAMRIKNSRRLFRIVADRPGVVILENLDIEKGFHMAKWKGMKSAEDYQRFSASMETMYEEISNELPKYFPNYKVDYSSPKFLSVNDSLTKVKAKAIFDHFIKKQTNAYVSAFVLATTGKGVLTTKDLENFYGMISPAAKHSYYGKNLSAHLEGLKNSVVGKNVIPFVLPTPEGKTIEFASLSGKYILIDFWASWCGPCIASFPHMKEIYAKYKSLNFNILSISVDKNKDAWLAESKKQQLPWLQVLDTENISKKGFAVSAVPTMYLIDPDGKILMKEIDFEKNGPIEKKLKEIFETNKN